MSISKLQELFAKSGCGLVVLIVCAAVMVGGMFYYACTYSGAGISGTEGGETSRAVMHVAGNPVPAEAIDQQIAQSMGRGGPLSPDLQAYMISQIVSHLQDQGAMTEAVKQSGVNTDDAALLAAANERFDSQLDQARQQMISQKKLPADATPAQFDKAIKDQAGKTPAELRTDQTKQISDALKDSDKRKDVIGQLAQTLLIDAARAKHQVPDAEVRSSYQTNNYQQLQFLPTPTTKGTLDDRIKAAQADIAKGVPFDQLIKKYSNAPPMPGRKPGQDLIHYTQRELTSIPSLKALQGMKVGQVSPVIDAFGGKSIYKLASITSNLPKDYDKTPERYRKEYVDQIANQEVQDEIKKAKDTPGLLKFDSPAYQALYDAMQAGAGMMSMGNQAPQPDKLQKAFDEAKKAEGGPDARIAALAAYEAETKLWNTGDKNKLRAQRIDTLNSTLRSLEDFDMRMELVDDYIADGKNQEAGQQLLVAAENNTNYDDSGVTHFTTIRDRLQQLQKAKQIDAKTAQQIEDAQLKWTGQRADHDAEQQIFKKEQAAADAKMKAEEAATMAKARAEAAKKAKTKPGAATPAKPGAAPAKVGSAQPGVTPPNPPKSVNVTPPGKTAAPPSGPPSTTGKPK